jgi:acyl-CoA synthetase (AMP-forming)/AMP-acid ligase II
LWSEIAAWAHCEVINCYGITETANWIGGASSRDEIAEGLVGKPWLGEAAVRDDNGTLRADGEGEIVLRSAAVMNGYLHRADLTASVMQDGWYRSGDRGRIDRAGRIWLTGRIKEEINRAGFKVQPAELDRLLERHPAVAEACVFAQPDQLGGESVAVAIRLAAGATVSPESLRAWCRERLRREAVPEHWHIVDEIPRNARGKVNREGVRRWLVKDVGR